MVWLYIVLQDGSLQCEGSFETYAEAKGEAYLLNQAGIKTVIE